MATPPQWIIVSSSQGKILFVFSLPLTRNWMRINCRKFLALCSVSCVLSKLPLNDIIWVIKHLSFKMQIILRVELYCPLKPSSKRKVRCVKGGGRGIEHEEANFDHHFLLLVGQRSILQQNTSAQNMKQHRHSKLRGPGLSNRNGIEVSGRRR